MHIYLKLRALKGGREFSISDRSVLVGRSDFSDIQIDSPSLSREHARIVIKDSVAYISDLHSTNGTLVNSKRIDEAHPLKPGDLITFGEEVYSVQAPQKDATLMYDRRLFKGDGNADYLMIEDDEEENATVFMEKFQLPASWNSDAEGSDTLSTEAELVEALVKQRFTILRSAKGLAVVIYEKNKAPIVKTVSAPETAKNWTIGRSSQCDLQLNDPCISDVHAILQYDLSQWKIADNKSKNGVSIQNRKVTEHTIADKDAVNLGSITIQFRIKNES